MGHRLWDLTACSASVVAHLRCKSTLHFNLSPSSTLLHGLRPSMQRVHRAVTSERMARVADATSGAIALAVSSLTMLRGGSAAPSGYTSTNVLPALRRRSCSGRSNAFPPFVVVCVNLTSGLRGVDGCRGSSDAQPRPMQSVCLGACAYTVQGSCYSAGAAPATTEGNHRVSATQRQVITRTWQHLHVGAAGEVAPSLSTLVTEIASVSLLRRCNRTSYLPYRSCNPATVLHFNPSDGSGRLDPREVVVESWE